MKDQISHSEHLRKQSKILRRTFVRIQADIKSLRASSSEAFDQARAALAVLSEAVAERSVARAILHAKHYVVMPEEDVDAAESERRRRRQAELSVPPGVSIDPQPYRDDARRARDHSRQVCTISAHLRAESRRLIEVSLQSRFPREES